MHLQSAKALERRDGRRVGRRQREGRDLLIQDVPTRAFVFEEREVLAEDQPILGRKRRRRARELTQPRVVRGALPESPPVEEPAAREELENVVARLDHFSLQRLATPRTRASTSLGIRIVVRSPARYSRASWPASYVSYVSCFRCTPRLMGMSDGAITSQW